jgi:glycine/D-amino acid oxidase-like deaminating enzyme
MASKKTYDVAVIGAGVFGAWTALTLSRTKRSVVLVDAYGPGNARASSGGESRLIRMGYGPDELFTRWSARSLVLWQELFRQTGQPLFVPSGILWMITEEDDYTRAAKETLSRAGIRYEWLARAEMEHRWPQIAFGRATFALFEPQSGVLLARRAVADAVEEAISEGAEYIQDSAIAPSGVGRVEKLKTQSGNEISANEDVFACGPWLGKVFPDLLGGKIFVTRQEVFFFGVSRGDTRFAPRSMPGWLFLADLWYGMPDIESRGFKLAFDRHGPPFDPDNGERVPSAEGIAAARAYLAERFPALAGAPLVEARVCQYENTSNGDFLVDRHPNFENVWLVGGGSGHGFKHGPAMGEFVAGRLAGSIPEEPRFTLVAKSAVQHRTVF